jgi:hypothetical protein
LPFLPTRELGGLNRALEIRHNMTSSGQAAAAVELFSTSILSNHKIRSRHERYISILSVKKIPYIYHDLAGDEEAKSRWRRKVSCKKGEGETSNYIRAD